ncbi:MAG: nucleotidyltransferase domain-containing protein [Candidatus Marinimicrobia bacterium]|nr:nucleotidyltransferase domain-containing protein [Candidatus Neomarinimicrobiota bacterium]
MLDSLITSKTRIKLLLKFFMNPGTKSYLRGLANEFGESTNAIRVELNRLTKAKLLKSSNEGRTVQYMANKDHSLFKDLQSVVKKYVGIDKLAEELASKLGNIHAAYVIGDYARGNDSGLIDLVLIGKVDEKKLKEMTEKTEKLIERKIRTLVLNKNEFLKLKDRLNIKHSLFIWGTSKSDT